MTTMIPIDLTQVQAFLEKHVIGKPEDVKSRLTQLVIDATEPFMRAPGASIRGRVIKLIDMCKDTASPEYAFPGREEIAKMVQDFVSESDEVLSSDGTSAAFRFQTSSDLTSQGWTAPTHDDTGTTPRVCGDDDTMSS